ncbi:LacI family DNA-binding transcriptional regulator [Streptomyces cylindrosporus]|uniref:LacI family transcriptional regulator n=1 Tax=Streptomyces cylindrosporus TaxID=2927583 RepID=A0ABS9YH91_9ACTN|nr:LacI family DNA-binding transcriptional regulator [Streptomyces cylindrosporus]MCI3276608.1 LacI family transcriptional regulator [Streptomyces cylindrosporus]
MRADIGLKEVAERAGVSMRTVSNVVRDTGRFSEATRERVLRAVEELGYRPNTAARRLRTGRSGVLLLAVPELSMPYFAELAGHVLREAAAQGCTLLVEATGGHPEAELEIALGRTDPLVDGVILSPLALDDRAAAQVGVPLVLLGERVHELPCPHITIDNTGAAREATAHLLARGRRRVAVIGRQTVPHAATSATRLAGYRQALEAAGLRYEEALAPAVAAYGRADGAAAMRALLELAEPPDAVFCFADAMAEGALAVVRERGLGIPGDVAVVGFDDVEASRYTAPPLTTVAPDKGALARLAVGALVRRIGGAEAKEPSVLLAGHRLVVRESG